MPIHPPSSRWMLRGPPHPEQKLAGGGLPQAVWRVGWPSPGPSSRSAPLLVSLRKVTPHPGPVLGDPGDVAWPDMSPGPPGPSLSSGLLYSRGDPEYRRAHTYVMLPGRGRTGLHPTLGWGTGATLQHTLVHLWGLKRSVSLCLLPNY